MAKMFGQAKVNVDGAELLVDEKSKLNLGGVKRNTVKGTRVYGFAEETMEATVDVTIYLDADTDLDAINAIDDATIMFSCDSGQSYVLTHSWLTDPVDVGAAKDGGTVTLKFASANAQAI